MKFKTEWITGDYKGDKMVVMSLDTNISLFQLVKKLYSNLKIKSSLELTIQSFVITSTRNMYQIVDDDHL